MTNEMPHHEKLHSPCIRNCCLDNDDICLGCFRTLDEILCWSDVSEHERLQILLKADKRKLRRPQFLL